MNRRTDGDLQSIVNDAYDHFQGEDAQSMNLTAGRALGESVRTTLGPNGLDKMIVNSNGGVTVTNDGATILQEIDIDHPGAKLVAEVASSQESAAGDGTTTAVVLASELLNQGKSLIEDGIHPTSIVSGYKTAVEESYGVLDKHAIAVDPDDTETLGCVAETAMTGTGAEDDRSYLADLIVEAVTEITRDGIVNVDAIQLETIPGGLVTDSECIRGTTIKKEPADEAMDPIAVDAAVCLLDHGLQMDETNLDGSLSFDAPDTRKSIIESEEREIRERIDRLEELDTDVVFAGGELDSRAIEEMVGRGLMVFHKTPTDAMERLAAATGGTISTGVDALTTDRLGYAGRIESGAREWRDVVFVEQCADPDNVTLLLRGGPTHVMDELQRSVIDSIAVVANVLRDGEMCPGGCAMDIEIGRHLRDTAGSIGNREQLAVEAFADAIEVLPRTMAESAGHDPIDALVELRQRHSDGDVAVGFNGHAGEVESTVDAGVVDSLHVKEMAIETATQAAILLLRIDDVLLSEQLPERSEGDTAPDIPR